MSPSFEQVMIFTNVESNIGNGYSTSTGEFTAPKAGAYLFTLQACVSTNGEGALEMVVDNNKHVILSLLKYNDNTHYNTVSNSASVYLNRGQRVWVINKALQRQGTYFDHSGCGTQFTGVIVDY